MKTVALEMFELDGCSVGLTKALAMANRLIRAIGQKSTKKPLTNVRFHTIQFFFIKAK